MEGQSSQSGRRWGCWGTILVVLVGATAGLAGSGPARATEPGEAELTLELAVASAVAHYPWLAAERVGTLAAERSARGTRAERRPALVSGVELLDRESAEAYGLAQVNGVLGLTWTTTWGTELAAEVLLGRPALSSAEPRHTTSLQLEAVQPLLNGAWYAGARHDIATADLDADWARCSFERTLSELVLEVVEAYHGLVFAQTEVQTKHQALQRAEAQLAETRRLIDKGVLADFDVYVAEDNAVFFELEHAAAVVRLDLARRELAELMAVDPSELAAVSELSRVDESDDIPPLDVLVDHARLHDPGVRVREVELRQAEEDPRHARSEALPELDLALGLSTTGIDASFAPRVGEALAGGEPHGYAGLTLELPLDVGGTAAELEAARLERDRARGRLVAELDSTGRGVEGLLAELEGEREQLELATRREEISRAKLEAEDEKYRRGLSTLDDVLRFQRDLDGVVSGAAYARARVEIVEARLLEAAGLLLDRTGVRVEIREADHG